MSSLAPLKACLSGPADVMTVGGPIHGRIQDVQKSSLKLFVNSAFHSQVNYMAMSIP